MVHITSARLKIWSVDFLNIKKDSVQDIQPADCQSNWFIVKNMTASLTRSTEKNKFKAGVEQNAKR